MEKNAVEMRSWYEMEFDDGDPWGSVMKWRFAICDELYRRGADIPWDYSAGAGGAPDPEDGDFDLSTVSEADLICFGEELATEAATLDAAGRSY